MLGDLSFPSIPGRAFTDEVALAMRASGLARQVLECFEAMIRGCSVGSGRYPLAPPLWSRKV